MDDGRYDVYTGKPPGRVVGVIRKCRGGWEIRPNGKITRYPYRTLAAALADFEIEM